MFGFPYEHGPILKQELMHVFSAEIFVDLTPESGYGILASIIENLRCIGVCRNKVHKDFVLKNL